MGLKSISVSPAVGEKLTAVKEEDVPNASSQSRIFALLARFFDQTSLHGLIQVNTNGNYLVKGLWIMAFAAAFGCNMYHLSTLVHNYMLYPVQEVTSLEQRPSHFPAVTICNLDAISPSNREKLLRNKTSEFYKYDQRVKRMLDKGILSSYTHKLMASPGFIKQNIGHRERHELGHHLEDFVVSCYFRGEICNLTNTFNLLTNSFFYNCYTFDPKDRGKDFLSAGLENGLSMILYLEASNGTVKNEEYEEQLILGNAEGARIVIHPHGQFPMPHSHGLDILPGHSTSIGYRVQEVIKLGKPYGNCFDNLTVEELYGFRYHPSTCMTECQTDYLVNSCGCKTHWQLFSDHPLYDHIPYCGVLLSGTDEEDLARFETRTYCSYDHWVLLENNATLKQDLCDCPPRCSDFMYPYSTSVSKWPAEKFVAGFIDAEIHEDSKAYHQLRQAILESRKSVIPDYGFIRDNFARLNIYLEDSQIEHREQIPSYPLSNLFSDMGGTFGLWIGLSTLTILEFIQLVVQMILGLCGKDNI